MEDVSSLKWSKFPTPSPLMKNHTATPFENFLYIFGGFDGVSNSSDIRKLDVDTGEWSFVEPTRNGVSPVGRNGHSATLVQGNRIYYIGGWLGIGPLGSADVHVLDLDALTWSKVETFGASPGPCNMHTANWLEVHHSIFLFRGGDGQSYLSDLHVLDVETSTWKHGETMGRQPPVRANHCSTVCDTDLFIFGGWNGTDRLNDLFVLDTMSMTWREVETLGLPPTPRAGASLSAVFPEDPVLLLFGGSGAHSTCFNDLHLLHLASSTWSKVLGRDSSVNSRRLGDGNPNSSTRDELTRFVFYGEEAPEKRAGHTATLVGNRKLVVLGGSVNTEYRKTVFELDLDPLPELVRSLSVSQRHSLFVQSFASFYDNSEFSDVVFVLEEGKHRVHGHRVVLGAQSQYFNVLFSRGFRETNQTEVEIKNVRFEAFRMLIQFLYNAGDVDISEEGRNRMDTVQELFCVADQFMCEDLREECEIVLARMVNERTFNELSRFAQVNRAKTLMKFCRHYERWGPS